MRILDQEHKELTNPDLSRGKLVEDRIIVRHHQEVEAIPDQFHYETIAEYPNGGKDVAVVVDIPGRPGIPAWDEYEDILRYVPYTAEKLQERAEWENQVSDLDILEAQLMYTAMMTDTLLEV